MATSKKSTTKPPVVKKTNPKEVKILVEVVVKNEVASLSGPSGFSNSKAAAMPNFGAALALGEGDSNPNFEFSFSIPDGVRLSRIDIDGDIFDGTRLIKASSKENDKVVVKLFSRVFSTSIPMIIEGKGEPNRTMSFTLKFTGRDIFKSSNPQKIRIDANREGFLALPSVKLI